MARRSSGWWWLTLLLAGCGGSTSLTGKVSYDGKPIEKGAITFEPVDGKGQATGGVIEAGKYALEGSAAPSPGKQIVRIRGLKKTGKTMKAGPPFPPDKIIEEEIEYIPAEFNTKSVLTVEIDGSGVKDFELPTQGK